MLLNKGQSRNESQLIPARDCLAPHAVAHWATVKPDAPAIQPVGGKPISYRELDRIARRWAAALGRIGVTRGTHVATLLPNGEQAQCAFLGIGWLAAIEVPVNTALTGELLHYVLHNSDAEVLLVLRHDVQRVLDLCPTLPRLRTIVVLDGEGDAAVAASQPAAAVRLVSGQAFLAGVEPDMHLAGPDYRDIAAIMYTSGTTGPSKGVLLPWATIYQTWSGAPLDMLPEGGSIYCTLPLVHNSGRSCLQYALLRGARLVWRERFSGSDFWNDLRSTGCTAASLVVRVAAPWAISPGYYGMPEKTAAAWRNGWFHTGDVMRCDDDGWYYLIDRLKDSIRRRGENISSFEVESVVARYPGVTECAAIAVPAELGEDEVMVVLLVSDPAAFDYAKFFAWVDEQLPKFMCPRYAEAVAVLPRNAATQRIKKYELRARGIGAATRDRQAPR